MFRCGTIRWWLVILFIGTAAEPPAVFAQAIQGQSPSSLSRAPARADHSREPYVVDQYRTVVRFENDGTGERVVSARVRVQSEAAAEKFSELIFPYNADNEQIEIRSVVVKKADGTSPAIPAGAMKDLPLKEKGAAAYPGEMAKHVAVPALAAGDTLAYEVVTRLTTAFARNEFWFQHNFADDAIVLDEQLELNLPQGRAFSLKAPDYSVVAGKADPAPALSRRYSFSKTEENGRILLRWKHANLTHPTEDPEQRAQEQARKSPDVQLTTFGTWQEMARWESKLAQRAEQPSDEVQIKTADLIKGRATDEEKVRALYAYVSKNISVVDASFGSERFQPRLAADVLKNGYGDSADENSLLETMLSAAGIHADEALVPATRKLDAGLPSPAQFDRVLIVISNGANRIWLDPSDQVAPFAFLPPSLRGKSALLVAPDSTGKIVKTPDDPPFLSTQDVEIDGAVSELGKLSGTIRYSLRGDTEFVLRSAFHRASEAQWNELAETILTLDGLHAEVNSVKTSDPFDTEKPFGLTIGFVQQSFLDWSSKRTRVALPLLTIGMPDPPGDAKANIELGNPLNVVTHLKLQFPGNFSAEAPIGVEVARDYAEFKASYRFENGTMIADRSLNFKMRELPAARAADYAAFTHAVAADEAQLVTIENSAPDPAAIPASASANDLFDASTAALKAGNLRAGIPLLQRVTELDPKHEHAWNDLGIAYFRQGQFDEAIAAFRKQLEVSPSDEHSNEYLGLALEQLKRNDEAAASFRRQIQIQPLDTVAHAALGTILLEQRDDSGAVTELEKATILSPENADLEVSLGRAYLNTGQKEKALDAFHKAVETSPTPSVWNGAALNLADHNFDLDEALKYAQSAMKSGEESLANVSLSSVTQGDFAKVSNLAAYWDTIGWVYFRRGDLEKAERYVRAAWMVGGRSLSCDHLAQVYEKLGQKERAIQTYALALAAPDPSPDTRARLMLLLGGNAQIDELIAKTKPQVAASRTFRIKPLPNEDGSAEFLILFSASPAARGRAGAQAAGARFLSGSESLKLFADRLRSLNYGEMFPDGSPAKIVSRGTLACSASAGDCSLSLVPAAEALSRK